MMTTMTMALVEVPVDSLHDTMMVRRTERVVRTVKVDVLDVAAVAAAAAAVAPAKIWVDECEVVVNSSYRIQA
jgi:2-methylcitrate dehydratase PrpD